MWQNMEIMLRSPLLRKVTKIFPNDSLRSDYEQLYLSEYISTLLDLRPGLLTRWFVNIK